MFGLSKHELLLNAIENACKNEISIYEKAIQALMAKYKENQDMPDDEIAKLAFIGRREYLYAVCDSVWNSFGVSSNAIHARFRLALTNPQITGLPEEFNVDYIGEYGPSAGVVFAFAYFAVTKKCVNSAKLYQTMSMLNHFQNELMNSVLGKYDL